MAARLGQAIIRPLAYPTGGTFRPSPLRPVGSRGGSYPAPREVAFSALETPRPSALRPLGRFLREAREGELVAPREPLPGSLLDLPRVAEELDEVVEGVD